MFAATVLYPAPSRCIMPRLVSVLTVVATTVFLTPVRVAISATVLALSLATARIFARLAPRGARRAPGAGPGFLVRERAIVERAGTAPTAARAASMRECSSSIRARSATSSARRAFRLMMDCSSVDIRGGMRRRSPTSGSQKDYLDLPTAPDSVAPERFGRPGRAVRRRPSRSRLTAPAERGRTAHSGVRVTTGRYGASPVVAPDVGGMRGLVAWSHGRDTRLVADDGARRGGRAGRRGARAGSACASGVRAWHPYRASGDLGRARRRARRASARGGCGSEHLAGRAAGGIRRAGRAPHAAADGRPGGGRPTAAAVGRRYGCGLVAGRPADRDDLADGADAHAPADS